MSIVQKETIEVIAQSIGINNLSPEVALALAPDVEYRVREIMQEAVKCMRHSKRTILTAEDVDAALKLRNVEPIYGFASNDPLRFKKAAGHKDFFYVNDLDLDLKDVTEAPLPRAPLDTSVSVHWLAVEGVQPAIPENPPAESSSDGKKLEYKEDGMQIDIKLPIKHVLSRELQLYFDKVIELTTRKFDTVLFKETLRSLATDAGIHPLIPYFTCFIADEVSRNLNKSSLLFGLMRLVRSLLQNPHLYVEPYVHQLIPSVITCLVAKKLGNRHSDNHWELRNFSANLVAKICQRFGHVYHNLQPRVTRTLLHTFLDPKKAFSQHYGAIQGLAALGTNVVRQLILPNLDLYMQLLGPEMQPEEQTNEIKRHEAWQFAAGKCTHDLLKKFPSKRKASMDNMLQQPPLKKLSSDGAMGVVPMNSMQGVPGGFAAAVVGGSDAGLSAINQQLQPENISGSSSRREKTDVQAQKASALARAWKRETNGSRLLSSPFQHFGLSMLSFTPVPELSLFL
ncbi:Transcription initiation factor TFIID subunit 6 [Bienertia sinuspersici]